jgi:hypothetical protein
MKEGDSPLKRRLFQWSQEARTLVVEYQKRVNTMAARDRSQREMLVSKLANISGNPRDACLRVLRRFGIAEKRSYREWTKPEQQRLVELIDVVPVKEAARILRRPVA